MITSKFILSNINVCCKLLHMIKKHTKNRYKEYTYQFKRKRLKKSIKSNKKGTVNLAGFRNEVNDRDNISSSDNNDYYSSDSNIDKDNNIRIKERSRQEIFSLENQKKNSINEHKSTIRRSRNSIVNEWLSETESKKKLRSWKRRSKLSSNNDDEEEEDDFEDTYADLEDFIV